MKYIVKLLLLSVYMLVISCFCFGQGHVRYFKRMDRVDSITGVVAARYYDGKIFAHGFSLKQYRNAYTTLLKFDTATGIVLRRTHIDSLVPQFEAVQSDQVVYDGGYYYTVGYLSDYGSHFTNAFYKFDTAGNTSKIKELAFNNPGAFTSICKSTDGNLYAIGYIDVDTNSAVLHTTGLICKIDTGGNQIWQYPYYGTYANTPEGLIATPDSGILVSLDAGPSPNLNHAHLIKLDKNGVRQWDKLLPFSMGNNYVRLIDYVPSKSEYVFLASTYSDSLLIVKVDSSMQRIWEVSYRNVDTNGNNICDFQHVIKDRTGYIGVGGFRLPNRPFYAGTAWILKLDNDGHKRWEGFYDTTITKSTDLASLGGPFIGFTSIDTMPDGGYILGGSIQDSSNNQTGSLMRIDSNGCLTDTCEAHVFTGIPVITPSDVRIYPNPAKDKLYVDVPYRDCSFTISDMTGRVLTLPVTGNEISISALPRGIYFIQIHNETGSVVKRFIKE